MESFNRGLAVLTFLRGHEYVCTCSLRMRPEACSKLEWLHRRGSDHRPSGQLYQVQRHEPAVPPLQEYVSHRLHQCGAYLNIPYVVSGAPDESLSRAMPVGTTPTNAHLHRSKQFVMSHYVIQQSAMMRSVHAALLHACSHAEAFKPCVVIAA